MRPFLKPFGLQRNHFPSWGNTQGFLQGSYSSPYNYKWSSFFRNFSLSTPKMHGEKKEGPPVTITFVDKDGTKTTVTEPAGTTILEAAHNNKIDLEGACEGSCACSTCHVILPQEFYDKLPEASDEENDMLDLAFGLSSTSRLGCQIKLTPELDGMEVKLPAATRNLYVDGHKPSHH